MLRRGPSGARPTRNFFPPCHSTPSTLDEKSHTFVTLGDVGERQEERALLAIVAFRLFPRPEPFSARFKGLKVERTPPLFSLEQKLVTL